MKLNCLVLRDGSDNMKKDYVYLCGGMEGYAKSHMTGWRNKATKHLELCAE